MPSLIPIPSAAFAEAASLQLAAAASNAGTSGVSLQPSLSSPLEPTVMIVATVAVAVLAAGIMVCLFRMLRGPHLADRVLAADMLSIHVLGLVVVLAIKFESAVFFDAALVVAILGFASTVAFSQYIYANRSRPERADPEADKTAEVAR